MAEVSGDSVFIAGQLILTNIKSRERPFSVLDLSIDFPYTPQSTIPVGFEIFLRDVS